MEVLLKEKLWSYIMDNNPDLMFMLQEDYSVLDYLNKKIEGVKSIITHMISDNRPAYIIEVICMGMLTGDLKPSRFLCIRSLLFHEFETSFFLYQEAGILVFEILNLMERCRTIFETIGFTEENQEDPVLRNALMVEIARYVS